MKTNNKIPFLQMDERNKGIALRVIAVMYFITTFALQGMVIYRQFALGQDVYDFEDLAILTTFNSLFLITALLYFGAIPLQRIRIRLIILAYLAIIILGGIFTYFKYNVFQKAGLSMAELGNKLLIILAITGLIMLFFILFSYLGKRKLEKDLED